MGQYTDFIGKTILTPGFGGANMLQYGDKGGEIYISFQTLLRFIGEYINVVDKSNKPILKIDWESDKPCFAYSTTISCNLSKCYVYNNYVGTENGAFEQEGIAPFRPFTEFQDSAITALQSTLTKEADAEDFSIFPSIGNINYIYINVGFLSDLIFESSNNVENKATVRMYLQQVCDAVGKALGSVNDFQAIIDDDANSLTIVDFNQKRIKGLATIKTQNITTIKAQGLGSFVTNISAQSSVTPDIANMIAISAQANANQLGEEATSLSRLSRGLLDRIYPEKNIPSQDIVNDINLAQKQNTQFETTKEAYIQIIANQKESGLNKISLKSEDVKVNLENIPVELYKALLGKFTESNQVSTTFIPVKVDLTLAGISGIKIFQRCTLSSDLLPYTYSDNFDLMILGVSHQIDANSKWTTKLSAITVLKED